MRYEIDEATGLGSKALRGLCSSPLHPKSTTPNIPQNVHSHPIVTCSPGVPSPAGLLCTAQTVTPSAQPSHLGLFGAWLHGCVASQRSIVAAHPPRPRRYEAKPCKLGAL